MHVVVIPSQSSCRGPVQRQEQKAQKGGAGARGSGKQSAQGILGVGLGMAGTVTLSFFVFLCASLSAAVTRSCVVFLCQSLGLALSVTRSCVVFRCQPLGLALSFYVLTSNLTPCTPNFLRTCAPTQACAHENAGVPTGAYMMSTRGSRRGHARCVTHAGMQTAETC